MSDKWRIYDKDMGMVAVETDTKEEAKWAYRQAPEITRKNLVVVAPGEELPDDVGELGKMLRESQGDE